MAEKTNYVYYIQSKANAMQIPDLKVAMEVLKLMNINAKGQGIRNKDDAIKLVISELDKGPYTPPAPERKPAKGLKKVVEDDQNNRRKLVSKFEDVQKLYQELPPKYQKDLRQAFPGIDNDFEAKKNELKRSECTILVAGETASGKSSLINLLLGGVDLLPTSQLGCTSTICEIRTNSQEKKEAIAYYRSVVSEDGKKTRKPPLMLNLNAAGGLDKLKQMVAATDDDGDSPFERIEISWPFPMLEEGIVIVDTPGIGGSGNMAKYAEKYLSKSYGFIYVINSANAGGVQKGRLQNFLRTVINAAGEEGLDSSSTMFVVNRWEIVPEKDREAVKRDTFDKLSRFFSDLRSSQIHYMSVLEAAKGLGYNTMTPGHEQLLELVENLLPKSLRSRLNTHYRWLTTVLKRMIYMLKMSKVMAAKSMDKVKEELNQIKKQIERLEQNSKDSINYLKHQVTTESEQITNRVVETLKSRTMAERLFDWKPGQCPRDEDKKKAAADAIEKISNKIALEMNAWERDNQIVYSLKDKIVRVCERDFELMEEQIVKIEGALLDGDVKIVHDLQKSIKKPAPPTKIWKKAKEASVDEDSGTYKGLGGVIAGVSTLKAGDKNIKKLFSDYKARDQQRSVAKMQDATKLFLDSIFENKHLHEKVHTFFKRFVKGIDAVAKMIPDFLKADLQLMEMHRDEIGEVKKYLEELFPLLLRRSYILQGHLDLFYVNYIFEFDYKLSDLDWNQHHPPVGSGSFADVYLAEIKSTRSSRGNKPVALKVCRDPLKENTVSDILLEDRTMRELSHPNVVRYFGASYKFKDPERQRDMLWIMIMEVCKYTLKDKFIHPDVNNPGKLPVNTSSQLKAMETMASFAQQLCDGVAYFHQKGYVHRDLKLENVLVTDQGVVKLTDVGLTKKVENITGTSVGSPVYMAPEVLLQAHSEKDKDKADIYSLGIMLWEMWYGKDAAYYIQDQLFGPLDKAVRDGLRPSLKLSNKPPEPWTQLIESSWAYEPERRPHITVLCKFFEDFIKDARRM